jgi:uncharacterized protein (TIGR02145 family)
MKWPCPAWSHVPTAYEWQIACNTIIWSTCTNWMTYNSLITTKLRLPFAGFRGWNTGNYNSQSGNSYYWSSSPSSTNTFNLNFDTSSIYPTYANNRASGFSVRCLKN